MKCNICVDALDNRGEDFDDCIIGFLQNIKIHYLSVKTRLNESTTTIDRLSKTNADLLNTVEKLRSDLENGYSCEKKRRKTSSLESSDESDQFLYNKAVLPNSSTDDLNEAINTENWDESGFVPPTQSPATTKKPEDVQSKLVETYTKEKYEKNVYRVERQGISRDPSPGEKSINDIIPLKSSPEEIALPRRIKPESVKKNINKENKNVLNTSKWVSKDQSVHKNAGGALNKSWSMSFLQPAKSKDNQGGNCSFVGISPTDCKENTNRKAMKKSCTKLRQTKLNFNTKENDSHDSELENTFCEDLVAASPISVNIASNETGKNSKMLSLRKINRKKPDNTIFISPKKKTSSLSPEISNESTGNSPIQSKIKNEPITVKKRNLCLRIPLSPAKSDPGFNQLSQEDDSVFLLPSQPDDVICLEETDELGCSTVDLLKDMMLKEDSFSDILRENEKIHTKSRNEETAVRQRNLPVFNCNECEAYFKYIGKDLSDGEIEKRLRFCKHKKPISLHHTPEGFWNPYFLPLSPDDPRNETLIDTRFVDKKN